MRRIYRFQRHNRSLQSTAALRRLALESLQYSHMQQSSLPLAVAELCLVRRNSLLPCQTIAKNTSRSDSLSVNPFRDIRNWTRVPFKEDPGSPVRKLARLGNRSRPPKGSAKPPVRRPRGSTGDPCINWEEMNLPERQLHLALQKLLGVNKRLASLLTASALEIARVGALVMWLTLLIIIETIVLIVITLIK